MEIPRRLFIPLAACLMLASAQVKRDPASQIRRVREESNRALAAHDIRTFGASLAPDFVMVRGNGAFVPSRQAYLDLITADFQDPKAVRYERIPDKIELSSVAPVAAEHGHWTATLPNGRNAYTGTYLAMWRRVETEWRIRSELFVVLNCEDEATCAGYRQ